MKHQLINTATLERITRPLGAFPPTLDREAPFVGRTPEGCAYVPILDRPEHDRATQKLERETTLEGDGWRVRDLTEEEIEARNVPSPVTRLTIKRRLDELGKWEGFKAILEATPAIADEWNLANEISPTDPMFQANAEGLKAALGLTDEQFSALLEPGEV